MNESEYFTEDNRKYVDPNISLNEQNAFVDNLRNIQTANTNQINRQTHALGSDLPSTMGGLGGSEGLFQARYQTPQTNAMVADLKAAAQQEALNTSLSNYKDMINKKLKDAYKKYARKKTTPTTPTPEAPKPKVKTGTNDAEGTATGTGAVVGGSGQTVIPNLSGEEMVIEGDKIIIKDNGKSYDARDEIRKGIEEGKYKSLIDTYRERTKW